MKTKIELWEEPQGGMEMAVETFPCYQSKVPNLPHLAIQALYRVH